MKKALVILLVVVMVGGAFASVLFYFLSGPRTDDKDPFAAIPDPVITSFRFADLSGWDLRGQDLSQLVDPWTLTFDEDTLWPEESWMPPGFDPSRTMEAAKRLGLGLERLHEKGATGAGVSVAIIDGPIPQDHRALPALFEYIETGSGASGAERLGSRGAVLASILAGENGVAPSAKVYYLAVPQDEDTYSGYARAMEQLIGINEGLPDGEKIRLAVVPKGPDPFEMREGVEGASDWGQRLEDAKQAGLAVVYLGMEEISFTGAGANPQDDRDNPASYRTWTWEASKGEVLDAVLGSGIDTWEDARQEISRLLTDNPYLNVLTAEIASNYLYLVNMYEEVVAFDDWLSVISYVEQGDLAFPVDYLTLPNANGKDAYTYYGSGGLVWAVSYASGLLTLGFQAKPDASPQELYDALWSTAFLFETGGRLVNPAGFLEALKPG